MEQANEAKELENNEKNNQNDKAFYSMPEIHQLIEKYNLFSSHFFSTLLKLVILTFQILSSIR